MMMRIAHPTGAVLTLLMLTASVGWSQEAETTEDPNQDAAAAEEPAPEAEATEEAATAEEPAGEAAATGDPATAVAREENGRYYNAEDIPTFRIADDGTVDWLTYSGFRRYHSECHVCHGPDGEGSSYAPALKDSAMRLDYYDFIGIVAGGRQNVDAGHQNVMPAFGDNFNVMCYVDDIWVYLRARGSDAIPRGRPAPREDKADESRAAAASGLGT
jgi:methanol metabolism-related c-type cytochrome